MRGEQVIIAHHDTQIDADDHVILFLTDRRQVDAVSDCSRPDLVQLRLRSILAVVNVLGQLLALFGVTFLLPIATALIYGETAAWRDFLQCAGLISCGAGSADLASTRRFTRELKPRDGYLLVSLAGCWWRQRPRCR